MSPALKKDSSVSAPRPARGEAFRALRHRNFQLFFGGQLTSLVGTWMQSVAQGWLVLRLTNSPLMLGVVSFARFTPILLVSLFAGVIVDQVDRRRMIVITQILLMLCAFVLAALTWTGVVRIHHVIIIAALNGLASSFDIPGRQAFLVEMVGREDLPNAIALNSMMVNGARAMGPALAGLLLMWAGEAVCFFINGISYLAVIWSLIAMRLPKHVAHGEGERILKRLGEGLSYAWGHQLTLMMLALVAVVAGFSVQYIVLMPVFARDLLHAGPRGYGFLLAAQGIGAVGGAILIARRSDVRLLRFNLVGGLFCLGGAITVFALSHSMLLSLAAQALIGAGQISYLASTNTILQLTVADRLRGRVMSMYTLAFIGTAPLGSLEIGAVGEHFGPRLSVMICGALAILSGCYLLARLKLVRETLADTAVSGELRGDPPVMAAAQSPKI